MDQGEEMTTQIQAQDAKLAVAQETAKFTSIKAAMERYAPQIAEVVPSYLSADRLLRLALSSIRKDSKLLDCPVSSLLSCVVEASRLGLEIGGALGQAYLVPFKGVATLMIGYRGYVELMRRGGTVSTIRAVVVFAKDHFELREGLEQVIDHRPFLTGDPGALRFVYAVAKFAQSGDYQAVFLTRAEVDSARARSASGQFGPWVTDYNEMAKKTAVRRLAKLMPLTVEAAEAIERDDESSYVDSTAVEVAQETASVSASVKKQMAEKRKHVINEEPSGAEPPDDVVLPTVEVKP
jgi:recombination protein RecT